MPMARGYMPMARATLGSMSAVRMVETRLTLWLSITILPEIGTTPCLATWGGVGEKDRK